MIEYTKFDDGYNIFPYRPRHDAEHDNGGGIDLTREPQRIGEIKELRPHPALRQAVYDLNTADCPFMSLGIALWDEPEKNAATGYIEIGCREPVFSTHPRFLYLDEAFARYLGRQYPENRQMAESLLWEYRRVTILPQTAPGRMLSIFCLASDHQRLAEMFAVLCRFFQADPLNNPF